MGQSRTGSSSRKIGGSTNTAPDMAVDRSHPDIRVGMGTFVGVPHLWVDLHSDEDAVRVLRLAIGILILGLFSSYDLRSALRWGDDRPARNQQMPCDLHDPVFGRLHHHSGGDLLVPRHRERHIWTRQRVCIRYFRRH